MPGSLLKFLPDMILRHKTALVFNTRFTTQNLANRHWQWVTNSRMNPIPACGKRSS